MGVETKSWTATVMDNFQHLAPILLYVILRLINPEIKLNGLIGGYFSECNFMNKKN